MALNYKCCVEPDAPTLPPFPEPPPTMTSQLPVEHRDDVLSRYRSRFDVTYSCKSPQPNTHDDGIAHVYFFAFNYRTCFHYSHLISYMLLIYNNCS